MARVKLFAFEGIDQELELMPMAARRALGGAGIDLSLEGWRTLPLETRRVVVCAGSVFEVDVVSTTRAVAGADVATRAVPAVVDPPTDMPPPALLNRLGPERSLPVSLWSLLSPLERYALVRAAESDILPRAATAYDEIVGYAACSHHVRPQGGVRMVDVSKKAITHRAATASSRVVMNRDALHRLLARDVPKGDVLGTARVAGIMAAKRTHEIVPLCHLVAVAHVELDLSIDESTQAVEIRAEVEAVDRTGVEMEALVAASAAALTIYDMLKAFDRGMRIGPTQLIAKSGGRSGTYPE
jgi:cyclic pyranopterin phosphate synthase